MGNSTGTVRRGALKAGEKTAQLVIFVCMLGVVGAILAAPLRSEQTAPGSAPPLPTATRGLFGAQPGRPSATPTATPEATPTSEPPPPTQTPPEPTASKPPSPEPTKSLKPPTATPTPGPHVPRIGIVAGHWWLGDDGRQSRDVGAVCDEGEPSQLTELEINLEVAKRLFFQLIEAGYDADLLQEWDERLNGYRADVLVSVHADACLYPEASGFKVARVMDSHVPEVEDRLVACLGEQYRARTGLALHEGSITEDMSRYHTFYEIDPNTPAVIIEVGFMLADRWLLTQRTDLVAQGIIDGILCFLEEEGITLE